MSGTPSSAEGRDSLLSIGRQCSETSCMLVDFLPFTCQHCHKSFCGDHFLPAGHRCPDYDEHKHNRVAPSCPLCHEIIAIPPGQDPNIRMEQHISTQCSVMTGKSGKSKSGPVCARNKCGKVLFAPIRCDKCKEQFCPQHRFPGDHNCKAAQAPAQPVATGMSAAKAIALAKFNSRFNAKPSSSGSSAAKPPRKPTLPPVPNPPSNNVTPQASTSTSKPVKLPFSAADRASVTSTPNTNTDSDTNSASNNGSTVTVKPPAIDPIRSKAERESKRQALQERAKKGLLTEEEKAMLAAQDAAETDRKDDCSVM